MRRIIGFVVGCVAGFVSVAVIQAISSAIFPAPPDLDFNDTAQLREWIDGLPIAALLIVLCSHAGGAFVGAAVCEWIVGNRWVTGWMLLGGLVLVAGIVNLFAIPHPTWFAIADVLLYLPAAWLGGSLVDGRRSNPSASRPA